MKEEILFSVLIANYNNGKYIKYAIQSVLDQTYPDIEIVIVDDFSTDNSVEIIKAYACKYSNIRFYKNTINKGCGFTKRRAANLAKGTVLGYLDPDDVLLPTAVENMVQKHYSNRRASLISSSHYVCNENLEKIGKAYGACAIPNNENYLTFGKGITAFSSFKQAFYLQTEGVDAMFKRAVDQDLYYKLEEVGEVLFIPKILYKYRVHRGGISSYNNMAKAKYWLVKAKEAAYQRRLKMPKVRNITPNDLRSWWSVYYASEAGVALGTHEYRKAIHYLWRSIAKSPVDRRTGLKLKSLLVHVKLRYFRN